MTTARYLAAAAACICMLMCARAQDPRKVGEIYDTSVWAVQVNPDGALTESAVPARLSLLYGAGSETPTTATFEANVPDTATLVRIGEGSLPVTAASLAGDGGDRLYMVVQRGMHEPLLLEMTAPRPKAPGAQPMPGDKTTLTIVDPTGKPASGLEVSIKTDVFVASSGSRPEVRIAGGKLGTDGRLTFRTIAPPRMRSGFGQHMGPFMEPYYRIVVRDPATGQQQILRHPRPGPPASATDRVCIALANPDVDAVLFRGKVLNPDGSPAAGAGIGFHWLEMPGRGGHQFFDVVLSAGTDGSFSVGLPVDWAEKNLGQTALPNEARLQVNINGSQPAVLAPGQDNLIKLKETASFVFEFQDENGQPVGDLTKQIRERGGLRMLSTATYFQPAASGPDDKTGRVTVSGVPVPGEYRVELGNLKFPQQKLEPGQPGRTVVWRRSGERVTVVGRILEAETGAPIAGAYVLCANEQSVPWTLNSMDAAEREEIWSKWESGGAAELLDGDAIVLRSRGRIYSVAALGRTDANGEYRVQLPPGKAANGLAVAARGRVGAQADLTTMKGVNRTSGEVKVPDVGLPKAAEATVVVEKPQIVPDPHLRDGGGKDPGRVNIGLGVGFEKPAGWSGPVIDLRKMPQTWRYVYCQTWSGFGGRVLLHVPAGVAFHVTASAVYEPTLGVVTWSDAGPLPPGGKVDLPPKQLPARRPFLVVVKNADGSPAAGMAVRLDGNVPIYTDDKGEAIGWTSGHVERLEVYPKTGWEIAAKKNDFDIPESGETARVELTLK